MMLARKHRLPVFIFRTPEKPEKVFRSQYFLLKIFTNDSGPNRFGIIVGTNVEKKAVARNYWKRRLRAFFAAQPNSGQDFLLVLSARAKTSSPRGVVAELEKIFKNLRVPGTCG